MSTKFTASFAAINVCGNPIMPIEHAESDMRKVAALSADVTAGSEISNRGYKRAWRRMFGLAGHTTYNSTSECPISTTLPVRRSWTRKLHSGLARVTPARYNSYLRLRTPVPLLVIAKHPVSGWDRRGANRARTFNVPARKRFAAIDTRLTSRRIARANRKGTTVVVMGDLNTVRGANYSPGQIIASHHGLDWIVVCPAPGVQVRLGTERVLRKGLHTDHAAIYRKIAFTKD